MESQELDDVLIPLDSLNPPSQQAVRERIRNLSVAEKRAMNDQLVRNWRHVGGDTLLFNGISAGAYCLELLKMNRKQPESSDDSNTD